ncbi:MAG: hypothetical protein WCJ72_14910 [Chryseobacterium sp.]
MQKEVFFSYIQDLLSNAISVLKDEEYQRDVWFRQAGKEVSSYEDVITHFLSRCGSIFKDPSCMEQCGKENYFLLKKLYDLVIEHIDLIESRMSLDDLKEEELLDNPHWQDIQALAGEVYMRFIEK